MQVYGDLEDVRDGVIDDHREVQDNDEGEEDVRGNKGFTAIDDEDDKGNDSHDQGRKAEDEGWVECCRTC